MATFKNRAQRPQVAPPDLEIIPAELRARPQWVLWRFVWVEDAKGGSWSKVPFTARGANASTNDPATWGDFETVSAVYLRGGYDGIGFVFSPDDEYCGTDFDNCVVEADGDFMLTRDAERWVERFSTYTELSPSGTGLHMIARARVATGRKDTRSGIEVYDRTRYFTFTGRSWHENPLPVADRQKEINALWSEYFAERAEQPKPAPTSQTPSASVAELLGIAFRARNGSKIKRLFDGDTSAHGDDDSAADLALCNLLAFYSGGDAATLDAMFRASRLMRRKWDTKHYGDGRTYGEETIAKAIASCGEFYRAGGKTEPEPEPFDESIRSVADYGDDLEELYETGYVPGVHAGWTSLASYYTVKPGQWTVVTGSPGAGKSVWLNALLVNLAERHNWRFAVCSPEFWPVSTHIAELMALHVGEPFVPGPTPRMSRETARDAARWVGDHFTFIEPVRAGSLTMNYALKAAAEIHARRPINGLVLDPWTEFEQDRERGETETDFVKRKLTDFIRFIRAEMLHGWIVAHPAKLQRDKNNNYPVPTLYDISGSSHWFNKAHMGISLHRPDKDSNRVQIHVQKVKFRWCGRLGMAELYYDKVTGQYSDFSVPEYVEADTW